MGYSGAGVVSFALEGDYYQQTFNSRGFPSVASGADVVSVFVGNGQSFRAVMMTSLGGIRTYRLETMPGRTRARPDDADKDGYGNERRR